MPTETDWGHGPNVPVRMYTETQIREVLVLHHETGPDQGERGGLCSCRYIDPGPARDWNVDHVIEQLEKL